jgi:hypothetical protein
MTRNGKIARLPHRIRFQLNTRLRDGESNRALVAWLNSLPEVSEILSERSNGKSVTEQNLSEWKQGGYVDWLKTMESCEVVERLASKAQGLEASADDENIPDLLATVLAAELAKLSEEFLKEGGDLNERWSKLKDLLAQLDQLRQQDHKAGMVRIAQERWNEDWARIKRENKARESSEVKRRLLAPLLAKLSRHTVAQIFGGGEPGEWAADTIHAVQNDWPLPPFPAGERAELNGKGASKANPTESD